MALIKCEECHKEISDTVKFCPHCGFKRTTKKQQERKEKLKKLKSNKKLIIVGILVLVVLIAAIILYVSVTGSMRNAKKMTEYLESRGFTCSKLTDGDSGYICDNKEDGKTQEFKIFTSISFDSFPSSLYTISWGKNNFQVYSQLYAKGTYYGRGNCIELLKDGVSFNYVPTRKHFKSIVDIDGYRYDDSERLYVGDEVEEFCDYRDESECSNFDDLVNETLRFYEKVHKNSGLDLEAQD